MMTMINTPQNNLRTNYCRAVVGKNDTTGTGKEDEKFKPRIHVEHKTVVLALTVLLVAAAPVGHIWQAYPCSG